jgi:hypothetical protein
MFARVARWEGNTAEELQQLAEEFNSRAKDGPPEGVPATGFMMLADPDNGRSLAIALFATEEDLRKGDETLNGMTPSIATSGHRVWVEHYEVPVNLSAP